MPRFAGEDLHGKERLATQREQQQAWLKQQLAERQTAEEERRRAERALQEAMLAQDRHAQSMQHVQDDCRRRVQQATRTFNEALVSKQIQTTYLLSLLGSIIVILIILF